MKSKRNEEERSPDECRTFGRCCLVAISVCVIWGLIYMPLKTGSRVRLPASLSWMVTQRDLTRYVLPDNNTYLLLPKVQCNVSQFIVIIVCSSVPNFDSRQAIRDTWGQGSLGHSDVQLFFLLGKSWNESLNAAVIEENSLHSDIIQHDFHDTYNNLTVKSVMMLKWVIQNCAKAEYIMKTDDDMFVHIPNLVKLLQKKGHKKMLLGCLIKGAVPVKDWNSKWFVPEVIFPGRVYPPYLSGTGYVMSRDSVPILYNTALNTPFFYLEDIFITGVCARRAGLKPINNEGFKFYKRKNDTCLFRSLITAHRMSVKELNTMWKKIHDPSIKCKS